MVDPKTLNESELEQLTRRFTLAISYVLGVNRELASVMKRAWGEVFAYSQDHKLPLRDAAMCLSVARVARAAKLRGYI
jgi:glutamate dehydrogenase/leucine dehydrogenase